MLEMATRPQSINSVCPTDPSILPRPFRPLISNVISCEEMTIGKLFLYDLMIRSEHSRTIPQVHKEMTTVPTEH